MRIRLYRWQAADTHIKIRNVGKFAVDDNSKLHVEVGLFMQLPHNVSEVGDEKDDAVFTAKRRLTRCPLHLKGAGQEGLAVCRLPAVVNRWCQQVKN